MADVAELKKALKKAENELKEKDKLLSLKKTLSPEDRKMLLAADDLHSNGHTEKIKFTLEIEMSVIASPENDFRPNVGSAIFNLLSCDGITKALANEMIEVMERAQYDDDRYSFSWAENLAQAKSALKQAAKKADEYALLLNKMAKKYGVTKDMLSEAVYQIKYKIK